MATRRTTARRATSRRRTTNRKVTRQWSRQEIQFMRKYYRQCETSWVARQLGRTVYSVRYKASSLNIKKANPTVWKGNRGNKNAWSSFGPKTGSRPTPNRNTQSRRTPKNRQWKASWRNRQNRTATPRRRSR